VKLFRINRSGPVFFLRYSVVKNRIFS